jgi:glycosyltransferase involved in cell wall biosynthesis
MVSPLITIGITCFNAQDTIVSAVRGALEQDWPHLEILIIDDASSDSSAEIIKTLTQDDERVRLIRHETNQGYPAALNSIVRHARGELIAFFDDDDISRSDRLSRQYERITSYEYGRDPLLVFCYTNRHVAHEGRILYSFKAIGRTAPEPQGNAVADFILWNSGLPGFTWGMFGSCTLMARKSTFEKLGGFDETFRRCAEWDIAVRGAMAGGHFIAVNDYLVTQAKTFTTDKAGSAPLRYSLQLRRKHKAYLSGRGVYYASLMCARYRFCGGKGRNIKQKIFVGLWIMASPARIVPFAAKKYFRKVKAQ